MRTRKQNENEMYKQPLPNYRSEVIGRARLVVVKIGSSLLAMPGVGLNRDLMTAIAVQIDRLHREDCKVVLVTSGAIAMGMVIQKRDKRPKEIASLQGLAAMGQVGLMEAWGNAFARKRLVAQLLVTRQDFQDRLRCLSIRKCIDRLLLANVIPIINENDAITADEIKFGDNDILAAHVSAAISADVLVLLTVVEGLKDERGRVLSIVSDISDVERFVRDEKSVFGSGGMQTKLESAKIATNAGACVVIASGRERKVLQNILSGKQLGTLFIPAKNKLHFRQSWISHDGIAHGTLVIDRGASQAISRGERKSLLAVGITQVKGSFAKGDIVLLIDPEGNEIARGLTNFSSAETSRIIGKKSAEIPTILGNVNRDTIVHADNLVLSDRTKRIRHGPICA